MKEIKKQGMESLFCSYEQALELKELGFDESCFGWFKSTLIPSNFTEYFLETEFGMNESPSDWVNSNFLDEACSAPLYQQAFRWFRDKYGLYSAIDGLEGRLYYKITQTNEYSKEYNKYEEAELACLKKLIEIVKND